MFYGINRILNGEEATSSDYISYMTCRFYHRHGKRSFAIPHMADCMNISLNLAITANLTCMSLQHCMICDKITTFI